MSCFIIIEEGRSLGWKRTITCLFFASVLSTTATPAERTTCELGQELRQAATPERLREIAASCSTEPTAALFYNRAYHIELLQRYRTAMQLQALQNRQEDAKNYHAYRIFIGLSEAFADLSPLPEIGDSVAWLNSVYDRAGEIAEMRVRGYDLQADRLENELWSE